jgi:protein associated with RNAse G/E
MTPKAYLEIKEKLNGERQYFNCTLMENRANQAVLLYQLEHSWRIGGLIIPKGTLSFGYFWTDKPYNAYHWLEAKGQSIGVYFNISDQTHLSQDQVNWRDLNLDLLVTSDGRYQWLDLDEFNGILDGNLKKYILDAKEQLQGNYPQIVREIEQRSNTLLPEALQIN